MELLGIALFMFLCRAAIDGIHAVKGTSPPHLERARLRAQNPKPAKQPRERSPYAANKPRLRDVAAAFWGDALEDAIDSHDRRRAEKQAQRAEDRAAAEEGREPRRVRPPLRQRIVRFVRRVFTRPDPDGQQDPAPNTTPTPDLDRQPSPEQGDTAMDNEDTGTDREGAPETTPAPAAKTPEPAPDLATLPPPPWAGGTPSPTGTPTGEAVNYETTVAELEALIERLRAHLDSTVAAVASIRQAKVDINNSQQSYNPAAAAAQSISEHLPALHVDPETVGHTGTVANAMPPNAVNDMFDRLEEMEAAAVEQQANAEAALGSAEQALKVVQEKYGDAHATVQGELAGDSRFLAGANAA